MSSVTNNSRMLYALSRDQAVPCADYFAVLDGESQVPRRAVFGSAFVAQLLVLPALADDAAFNAVTSIGSKPLLCSISFAD